MLSLNEKDTILIPDVAWGNYQLICKENNLNVVTYDPYNIDEIIEKTNNDNVDIRIYMSF